ncbi:MAG TPA: hypothetical protein VFH27_01320 [Longimicrobiaceae bacterium]|nr:hypothetical protein [Longimicrobiaceae bacterium]
MSVLLGIQCYDAQGDARRRQDGAVAALAALAASRDDVDAVNLQWADSIFHADGLRTLASLREDSRTASGIPRGPRKPIVREMLDLLCDEAARTGRRWFGAMNADIVVTAAAIDRVVGGGRDGYAFSRVDVEAATGREVELVTAGLDLFVFSVDWWRANRERFRAYVAGEPVWDNVYAAILLAHSDGEIVNRQGLVRHERHPAGDWRASPLAEYTHLLAALDSVYFTLWAHYFDGLQRLRPAGVPGDEAAERALRERVFRYAPSPGERTRQAIRGIRARLRYARHLRRAR